MGIRGLIGGLMGALIPSMAAGSTQAALASEVKPDGTAPPRLQGEALIAGCGSGEPAVGS